MGIRATVDWETVRAGYEAGAGFRALATKHGISHTGVRKRAIKEGWSQDLEPVIQRKVSERVSGVVSTGNPEKRAEAITAEAERRAAIDQRRRLEWEEHRRHLKHAIDEADFESAKLAKITAETLQICQAVGDHVKT